MFRKFEINHISFIIDPPLPPHRPCRFCRRARRGYVRGIMFSYHVALDAIFSFLFVLIFSMSFFISSRSLLASILTSQTDPPTFKNGGFMMAGVRFFKNHHFRSKDGFGCVLGFPWASLGSSWGSLGGSLGPLHRPQRASRFLLQLAWASFARFLLLLLVSFRSSFFNVVFYLLTEPPWDRF